MQTDNLRKSQTSNGNGSAIGYAQKNELAQIKVKVEEHTKIIDKLKRQGGECKLKVKSIQEYLGQIEDRLEEQQTRFNDQIFKNPFENAFKSPGKCSNTFEMPSPHSEIL